MKQKPQKWILPALVSLGLSTLASFGAPVITVNTFDANANGAWDWYGGVTLTWDSTQDHSGNAGGSLLFQKNTGNDSIMVPLNFNGNNWNNGAGASSYDLTLYTNLSLWLKWDTSSSMGIDTFNSTFGGFKMLLHDNHLGQYDWSGGGLYWGIPPQPVPNAASNGWVHLNFPFNNTVPYINQIGSIVFRNWAPTPWSGTVNFWVDDIEFQPAAVDVIPPPTIKPLSKLGKGLNVFNSTAGIYDRQEAMLRQTNDLGWVGQATVANPVSYSFTIAGFPQAPSGSPVAYMFLSPNPGGIHGAPDWNETNCVEVTVQSSGTGTATMYFKYKVNNPNNNAMYNGGTWNLSDSLSTNVTFFTNAPGSLPGGPVAVEVSPGVTNISAESGYLAAISDTTPYGTWTVKFTSDTSVALITPSGNTTNFAIPAHQVSILAPSGTPMQIYLGGQANNNDALYQAVVYSDFSISNSVVPFYENFLTNSVLDTTNTWNNAMASGPNGVFIVPEDAAYWMTWTLPAAGFSAQVSSNLVDWTTPANNKTLVMNATTSRLISTNDLPVSGSAFFRLIKRVPSKLQTLLASETNAPGTITGKTGTIDPVTVGVNVPVTINSVDPTWYIAGGVAHTINLAISPVDPLAVIDADAPLVNGTVTILVNFGTPGNYTITATDVTDGSLTSSTSASITVNP